MNNKLIKTVNKVCDKYFILDSKYKEGRNYCVELLVKESTNYTNIDEYCDKLENMEIKEFMLFLIQLQKEKITNDFNNELMKLSKFEELVK